MRISPSAMGLVMAASIGAVFGLGAFTFDYAEGTSYFSTDPKACANCHIMQEQYDSWQKSSHHGTAGCVDCHLPTSFVPKYIAKAENGYWHSKGFTFQDFHEPIQIKPKNVAILHENCLRCHGDFVHAVLEATSTETVRCTRCHVDVGHHAKQ